MVSLRRPVLVLAAVSAVLATSGCAEQDTEAPAAPRLEAAARTALETTVLRGSAEYGATLTVTREPAAAAELAPGLIADPYTAEFSVEVPLELGENVFTVVASDTAGNRSQPATVTVLREKAAARLTLSSLVTLLDADRGSVELVALVLDEEATHEGREITLLAAHETEASAKVEATAKVDAQGRARATLTGLTTAGVWKITAASKDDAEISDSLTVLVRGGAPATLELTLQSTGPGGAPANGNAITVVPNSRIQAQVTIKDAPQNVLDVPVTLYTDAPGALVAGASITGVVQAGTSPYRVVAVANGTTISGEATFLVVPGNLASLELTTERPLAVAGEPVALQLRAADSWGNRLGDPQVTFTIEPPLAATFTPPGSSQPLTDQGVTGRTFKAYDLSGVEATGYRFTVTAELPSSTATASTQLEIRPGPAAGFALVADPGGTGLVPDFFFTSGCAQGAPRCSTASVAAGQELIYAWSLADAFGNRTGGTVQASSDAPGSVVLDDPLTGTGAVTRLQQARLTPWTLTARIAGVAQPPLVRTFFVGAAAPSELVVSASPSIASIRAPVLASATVRDAFGNTVPCPSGAPDAALTLTSTPAAETASPLTCSAGIYSRTFTFPASGGYRLDAATVPDSVIGSTLVTVAGDGTPPMIEIRDFAVDGIPCGTTNPSRCTVAPNALLEFDAVAEDENALSELAYDVYFETSQVQRARTVLVAGGQRNHTVRFALTVPALTRPERTALVARATDLGGNITYAPQVLLDVSIGAKTTGGRELTVVTTDTQLLDDPSDVVQLSNGDVVVANRGNRAVLRLPAGSRALKPLLVLPSVPERLARSSSDHVYAVVSGRTLQVTINPVNTKQLTEPFSQAGTLAIPAPTPQRAFIRNLNTAADGNSATIDSGMFAMTYEIDLNGSCTPTSGRTCVPVSTGGSIAHSLANAINGNPTSRVSATVETATPATRVALQSKTPGEASTPLALSATGSLAVTPFAGGHDEEAWIGASNLSSTAPIYRYPLDESVSWPRSPRGGYHTLSARTLAVRDVWSENSATSFDKILYFSRTDVPNALIAYRVTSDSTSSTLPWDAANAVFGISGGGTAATSFTQVVDLALQSDGRCLLVADNTGLGKARVYAVNVGNPASTTPAVELILDGLERISGIDVDTQGRLLAVDPAARVIYRVERANPLPAGSCF